MLESTKEDATGLPEGSDIGLGARCREFESPHSDQLCQKNRLFRRFFFFLSNFPIEILYFTSYGLLLLVRPRI